LRRRRVVTKSEAFEGPAGAACVGLVEGFVVDVEVGTAVVVAGGGARRGMLTLHEVKRIASVNGSRLEVSPWLSCCRRMVSVTSNDGLKDKQTSRHQTLWSLGSANKRFGEE